MRNYRIDNEAGQQEALFQWATYQQAVHPELKLLHHIPNGGKRDKLTAIKLKKQGVKAGVPDLFLPVAKGGYHGFYIELKYGNNKLTTYQREWIKELEENGYKTLVAYTWVTAAEQLLLYLES